MESTAAADALTQLMLSSLSDVSVGKNAAQLRLLKVAL
jgi:hypothetical protein